MRWRVAIWLLLGLLGSAVGVSLALSTARPDTALLSPPALVTTGPSGPTATPSVTTPTPESSITPKFSAPRGEPTGVRITRQSATVMSQQKISGPVGLKRDSKGNLVLREGRIVLEPPDSYVAWYHEGAWPKPGFPGPSVLVAHINHNGAHGAFWDLQAAKPGDRVRVSYSSGDTVTFIITAVERTKKLLLPGDKIWNATKLPVLRLVTCDPVTDFQNGHYLGNVLVFADQLVGS